MSIQAMSDVLKLQLEPSCKFVLLMLANYCDAEGGSCFPSIARLVKDTCLSEATVHRALKSLRDYSGLIAVTPGGGSKSNRYQIDLQMVTKLAIKTPVTMTPPDGDTPVTMTPGGCHDDTGGVSPRHRGGVTMTPDPLNITVNTTANIAGSPNRTRAVALTEPTDEHRELAAKHGVDVAVEWSRYVDWLAASGKSHKDMAAGFRNWLRRSSDFAPRADKREAVSIAIWGDKAPALQRRKTIDELLEESRTIEGVGHARLS